MFDQTKFNEAKFIPRTEIIVIPELADFFAEGASPEFEVRGLTAAEYAKADAAKDRDKDITTLFSALRMNNKAEAVREARAALGIGDETPGDLSKRVEMLVLGTLRPDKLLRQTAVLFAERFPIDFYNITNKITILTGRGQQLKK